MLLLATKPASTDPAHLNRGIAYQQMDDCDRAIGDFDEAILRATGSGGDEEELHPEAPDDSISCTVRLNVADAGAKLERGHSHPDGDRGC
ncbi:hypothetical protein LCGC14_1531530 [marine sediment metagenome]|uniref:Tetratricopeptide repeat protein n=1 Tax=marine sediment metagenome TaxID=412755 RepID=A0A0F9IVZ3_9ZZZZ